MGSNMSSSASGHQSPYGALAKPIIGGAESSSSEVLRALKDYGISESSAAKTKIVSLIISAFAKLSIKLDGATPGDQLKSAITQIQSFSNLKNDPSKTGVLFHIAKVINQSYGSELINLDAGGAVAIAKQLSELMNALSTSMHAEFFYIHSNITTILKNLSFMRDAMKQDIASIKEEISKSSDPALMSKLRIKLDLADKIFAEAERQEIMLSSMLGSTLNPAEVKLVDLIRTVSKNDEATIGEYINGDRTGFTALVKDMLTGIGMTGQFAAYIKEKLASIGMTLTEYASSNGLGILREKITDAITNAKGDDAKLAEYLASARMLEDNIGFSSEYAKYAEKQGGLDGAPYGYATELETMDKKIKQKKAIRDIILGSFARRLNDIFRAFVASLNVMASKIGSEIPITDALDSFRGAVQRFGTTFTPTMMNTNIYYALIGVFKDALSLQKRDSALGELKMLLMKTEAIIAMSSYQGSAEYFKAIATHIKSMLDLIASFSGEIATKLGAAEDKAASSGCEGFDDRSIREQLEEASEGCSSCYEGGAEDYSGGDENIFMPKHFYVGEKTVATALRDFDYHYAAAQIKTNIVRASRDVESYGENYDIMLQNAIATRLEAQNKIYEDLKTAFSTAQTAAVDQSVKDMYGKATTFLDGQWEVKRKFWATLEAVETYMKLFTVESTKDIAALSQDIKAILDGAIFTEEWFTDNSGEALAAVFDHFPSNTYGTPNHEIDASVASAAAAAGTRGWENQGVLYPPASYTDVTGEHYYNKIKKAHDAMPAALDFAMGGHPLNPMPADRAIKARDAVKTVFKNLSIVKWLLAIFMSIASRTESESVRKSLFMSPAKIKLNIEEFLQASAFSMTPGAGFSSKFVEGSDPTPDATYVKGKAIHVALERLAGNAYAGASNPIYNLADMRNYSVVMSSVRDIVPSSFDFKEEQHYFVLMMKALSAKVFILLGRANLFERPSESNAISHLRMILGGNSSTPKIEDGAVELYLRLPLLIQFYYDLFKPDQNTLGDYPTEIDNVHVKIGLVPDFDGPFAGLIKLVFKRPDISSFSDDEVKDLVREVNGVYQRMLAKFPENTVRETINELIAEINRRYGVVSRESRAKYEAMLDQDYTTINYGDSATQIASDVPVLDGEEDADYDRPSGAERLLGMRMKPSNAFSVDSASSLRKGIPLSKHHERLLAAFRCTLDKFFEDANPSVSFKPSILAVQSKLKRESGEEERLRLIASFLRGVNVAGKLDSAKYLLFHETVVAGLNLLSAAHTLLSRFKRMIIALDIKNLEKLVWKYLSEGDAIKNTQDLITFINARFEEMRIIDIGDDRLKEVLRQIFGEGAAYLSNGGHIPDGSTPFAIYGANGIAAGASVVAHGTVELRNEKFIPAAGGAQHTGLFGLLSASGASPDALWKAYTSQSDSAEKRTLECFFRFLISRQDVMKLLVETLYGMTGDLQDLVSFHINDGRITIRFGALRSQIEDLSACVESFINVLRPHISPNVMSKYTDKMIPGSYYWLHEQIVEKLLRGRKASSDLSDKPRIEYISLDELTTIASRTYVDLTRKWNVDGSSIAPIGGSTTIPSRVAENSTSYDKLFADAIFYDAAKPQSGLRPNPQHFDATKWSPMNGDTTPPRVLAFTSDPFEGLNIISTTQKTRIVDIRYGARFEQLYSWDASYSDNKSLMFAFNQLIAKFIYNMYDSASQKIYTGLINQFANGVFSKNVMDLHYTYPDTIPLVRAGYNSAGTTPVPTTGSLEKFYAANANAQTFLDLLAEVIEDYFLLRIANGTPSNVFASTGNINGMPDIYARLVVLYIIKSMQSTMAPPVAYINAITTADLAGSAQIVNDVLALPSATLTPLLTSLAAAFAADPFITAIMTPSVMISSVSVYPFAKIDLIGSPTEVQYRASLLAGIITSFAVTQIESAAAGAAATKSKIDDITATAQRVGSAYVPAPKGLEAYFVKYDDLIVTDDSHIFDSTYAHLGDAQYLVAARRNDVGGLIGDNSITRLGQAGVSGASDDISAIQTFGQRRDPDGDHVLFTSLAAILKSLTTSRSGATLEHIVDNIADVPIYMKERFRANLPQFRNLFKELITRADYLKILIERTEMNVSRDWNGTAARAAPAHNPWPWTLKQTTVASSETKARFTDIINAVIRGSQALIQSCDTVLREVGGDARFLELQQGSLKSYRDQNNGAEPIVTLSSTLAVLHNKSRDNCMDFFPAHSLGDTPFKFAYGTRHIINSPAVAPTLEMTGGFNSIIDGYNLSTSDAPVDKSQVERYVRSFAKLLRFVHGARNIKGLISSLHAFRVDYNSAYEPYNSGLFTCEELVAEDSYRGISRSLAATTSIFTKLEVFQPTNRSDVSIVCDSSVARNSKYYGAPVYALTHSLSDTMRVVESVTRDDKIKELLAGLQEGSVDSGKNAAIQNIIDLNIVPINVHALMRGIPMANIYNYAHSYDRLAIETLYGAGTPGARELIRKLCDGGIKAEDINTAKDLYAALLIDPHMVLPDTEKISDIISDLMSGGALIGEMGRPKFLADQVYNKALFGELYKSSNGYSARGPIADDTKARFKQAIAACIYRAADIASGQSAVPYAIDVKKYEGASVKLAADVTLNNPTLTANEIKAKLIPMLPAGSTPALIDSLGVVILTVKLYERVMRKYFKRVYQTGYVASDDTDLNSHNAIIVAAEMAFHLIKNISVTALGSPALRANLMAAAAVQMQNGRGAMASVVFEPDELADIEAIFLGAANISGALAPIAVGALRIDGGLKSVDPLSQISSRMAHPSSEDVYAQNDALHYIKQGPAKDNGNYAERDQIEEVSLGGGRLKYYLRILGRHRMDTHLVRNMIFLVLLMRTMRYKMRKDAEYSRDLIRHALPATSSSMTELYGNNVMEHYNPNSVVGMMSGRYA